ncbi:MAG: sigma 54-interacting transcriptional regulator [Myxococcota bacterium]|nr:sigma 54-interacting transcriptional regulator [Myxococcota bacterium]
MKRVKHHDEDARAELLGAALEDVAGPALLLDARLSIVLATEGAEELVGGPIPLGTSAPKLLCGGAVNRPIAAALAEGVAVTGTVVRPSPGGADRRLIVRATPLERRRRRIGWVLLLDEERAEDGDAPLLFHGMWTRDGGMKHAFHIAERAARREATVLLRGETGTGKELFARAIHALSPRAKGPFAAINCAALPPSLLESELFGHVRGAFTGAVRDQPGFFKSADRGTAFLDEVAEMPLELQAKLLRVLETKTVIPVGGREPIPVDARIVAATHQSLRAAVLAGRFRADLMYRLRVIPIFLPPLRARPLDVALLAQKTIEELNRQGGRQISRLSPRALAALEAYAWPGNVRELRNALEYAYVIGEGPVLVPGDLPSEIAHPGTSPDAIEAQPIVNAPPAPLATESPEVSRIRRALERSGGSRERAAQMLGISRVTLWRRMRDLEIDASAS